MPRRALTLSVCSSSPSRLRCLAVLTAAWGSHSFRPPPLLTHRDLGAAGAGTSRDMTRAATAALPVARAAVLRARGTSRFGMEAVSNQRRHRPLCALCAEGDETAVEGGDGISLAGVEERPWLGNGPDPMTKTDKIRPGTSESLAAAGGGRRGVGREGGGGVAAESRAWLDNGPDPLASLEAPAAAVVLGGGDKGNGVPAEEMWLNGPFEAPLPPGPLDILYLDDDIVVANKPSNLLCVPGRFEKDSLATRAALELGHYRVDRMIVHRLDMATSGCVIMARSDAGLKDLNRQFREREVRKRYVAIVHGVLKADEGEVDLPLCRNRACPPLHMVNHEHGKPSLTKWRVLERYSDRTRVELIPVSGRSHQLRLHMDAIGHPILGDHFYGTKESLELADRCLLHAHTLCLRHPITGKRTLFSAPCEF